MWSKLSDELYTVHRGKLTIQVYKFDGLWYLHCPDVNVIGKPLSGDLPEAQQQAVQHVRNRLTELSANLQWMEHYAN